MSWSFYKTGLAANVKKDAAKTLALAEKSCERIPAEAASVRAFAAAIEAACDAAPGQALRVQGNGSAWIDNGKLKSFTFKGDIEVIDLTE